MPKKKDRMKVRKKMPGSFVREGRHARVAPEANRLDVRLHKRGVKKGENKRNLMWGKIYFRMENDIRLFVTVVSSADMVL